ncbi:MAG: hypothetical protein IPK60_05765 [Sandaracinaceae bacterium]|jgi:hypothetical protein|nr:hypothetical protein [Sandaracinaceae bacterium]
MLRVFLSLVVVVVVCSSCATKATDKTPSGALRLFIGAMQRGAYDPEGLHDAYDLLDAAARNQLAERAQLAGALAMGREFQPWDMLVRGRFQLRFVPARGVGMTEHINGAHATVTVQAEGSSENAHVPMTLEDGHWRVSLNIPSIRSAEQIIGP